MIRGIQSSSRSRGGSFVEARGGRARHAQKHGTFILESWFKEVCNILVDVHFTVSTSVENLVPMGWD